MTDVLRIAPEVQQALHDGGAVVALETTLVAHGFPPGVGVEVGRQGYSPTLSVLAYYCPEAL